MKNTSKIAKPCMICSTLLNPHELEQHENECFAKIQVKHDKDRYSTQKVDQNMSPDNTPVDDQTSVKKSKDIATNTGVVEKDAIVKEEYNVLDHKNSASITSAEPKEVLPQTTSKNDSYEIRSNNIPIKIVDTKNETEHKKVAPQNAQQADSHEIKSKSIPIRIVDTKTNETEPKVVAPQTAQQSDSPETKSKSIPIKIADNKTDEIEHKEVAPQIAQQSDSYKTKSKSIPIKIVDSEMNKSSSLSDGPSKKEAKKFVSPWQVAELKTEQFSSTKDENVSDEGINTLNNLHSSPADRNDETEEDISPSSKTTKDKDRQKLVLESTPYPDPSQIKQASESGGGGFSGNKDYKEPVPEMSRADEAAYQAHLKGLAPCSFCGRRFTPDRVMVHENACIERPKKRTYIVPDKNSIK